MTLLWLRQVNNYNWSSNLPNCVRYNKFSLIVQGSPWSQSVHRHRHIEFSVKCEHFHFTAAVSVWVTDSTEEVHWHGGLQSGCQVGVNLCDRCRIVVTLWSSWLDSCHLTMTFHHRTILMYAKCKTIYPERWEENMNFRQKHVTSGDAGYSFWNGLLSADTLWLIQVLHEGAEGVAAVWTHRILPAHPVRLQRDSTAAEGDTEGTVSWQRGRVRPSVRPSVRLSVCLFVCFDLLLLIYVYVYLSLCVCTCFMCLFVFTCLYVSAFLCMCVLVSSCFYLQFLVSACPCVYMFLVLSLSLSFSLSLSHTLSLSLSLVSFCVCLFLVVSFSLLVSTCVYMSLLVSTCVYMSLLVSTCVYMSLHVSTCVYLCLLVSTCLYLCLHVSTCVYLCLLVSTCLYLCLHVSTCVYLCLLVSTCLYLCLHVSTCVYVCLHVSTCVYLCILVSTCLYLCLLVSTCLYLCLLAVGHEAAGGVCGSVAPTGWAGRGSVRGIPLSVRQM